MMSAEGYPIGNHSSHSGHLLGQKRDPFDMDHDFGGHLMNVKESYNGENCFSNGEDKFVWTIYELQFQNEYLMSYAQALSDLCLLEEAFVNEDSSGSSSFEGIKSLKEELLEERQARNAAEDSVKLLQVSLSDADAKALLLSEQLRETQENMGQEIKERDNKYSELDAKFGRLHKRAKQRIQEVQKEKDDLDAQIRKVNEASEHSSSQLLAVQQELERTRQQVKEALKAMDAERQQLRITNQKLRDNVEELHQLLEVKEHALAALQQSLLEKEQMMEGQRGLLQVAEEKRQQAVRLEAQLADALSEKAQAIERLSSLQALLAEKESIIAEIDTASSGEAARLRAAMEEIKTELLQLRDNHEIEKGDWGDAMQTLRTKLDVSECSRVQSEIEASKMRSKLENELSLQVQCFKEKDSELLFAKKEIERLEVEFSSYKVRALALLQKKSAELDAAKDSQQINALEDALDEAEKRFLLVSEEKDRALHNLEDALAHCSKEIASRDATLVRAEQQIKSMQLQLDAADTLFQSEKEAWETKLQNMDETWESKCEEIKSKKDLHFGQHLQIEFEELQLQHEKLKEEHTSFRNLADKLIEQKDNEISKMFDENANLRQSIELKTSGSRSDDYGTSFQKQDASILYNSAAEQQILLLARQQAQREEELAQSQRHILSLQEEIDELERESRLHRQQETMLKEELRSMERTQRREGVDMTYLKNVILKLLQTGEVEALLPVIGMLLQFSPKEMQNCQQAYQGAADVPPNPVDESSDSGLSLFSRFSFS